MAELNGVYKCEVCGNVVLVTTASAPNVVCCGQEMTKQEPMSAEQEGKEKHVPVVTIEGNNVTVKVGSVPHPMEEAHFIQFIQLLQDGKLVAHKQLKPGDAPEAVFCLENTENLTAREYCNVHGLWKS